MIRIRRRISGFVTIAVLAAIAALAGALFGYSPAQAHTTTATLEPNGQGFHTAWDGTENDIDDTGTPVCDPQSQSIHESVTNDRESALINLTTIPNGATITSVDVMAWHRGDTVAGGTFQTFARIGGVDTDSGTNIATSSIAAACTGPTTQTIDVTDTVKAAGTVLEVGVVKTAANAAAVRVGALRATVTYNRAPNAPTLSTPANAATTSDRTPDFDWTNATDPDSGDALTYEIGRSPFVSGSCVLGSETISSVSTSNFTPSTNMAVGTHCWRVRTVDHGGLASPFTSTRTLTIQATNVTAAITAADKEYDGTTAATYTCDVVGEAAGDDVTCTGSPGIFDTATAGAGKTVTATGITLSGTDAAAYTLSNTTDTDLADITQATLSVDANNASKDYGDADPTFTYSLSGFVNGETAMTAAGLTGSPSCTRDAGENVAGSPFEITCVPGTLSATNYDFETGDPGEMTINKATLSVDADDQSKDYGDADPAFTYNLSGFANGEDNTTAGVTGDAACDRAPGQSVAGSPYVITCEPGTLTAANYDFVTGDTGDLIIGAGDVSAEITAGDKVYDGTTDAEYTCDVVGAQSGDDVTCDGTHPGSFDSAGAGTGKSVTATGLTLGGADAGNYILTNTSDDDEADITKATLSVDADDAAKDYGDDDPTFLYSLSGFIDGEDEMTAAGLDGSASCTRDAGENVAGSPFEITCVPGTLSADNYDFETGDTGELIINTADPNCTIDGFTGTYDGDPHGATGTCDGVDGEGPLNGLDLGESFTNVPGGTANWSFTDETGNYNDDSGTAEIVIDAATLTVDADDKSKDFGELDPPLTYTLGGFADGEGETSAGVSGDASCTRLAGETVAGSPYVITCEPGTLTAANYDFVTGDTGDLIIGAGDVSAEITAGDKVYDGTTDAEYTCDVVGAQSGDDVTCDGTHPGSFDSAGAGTGKSVTATGLTLGGADAGNYILTNTSDDDEADITKATLSVDADDAAKDYGDDDPTFLYSLSGFIDGEDEMTAAGLDGSASCTRDAGENVAGSPFEITCVPGTLSADNYDFETGDTGELIINTADPNCTIDGFTGTYDGDPHGATGTCDGVDGEGPLNGLDLGESFTNVPGGTANWSFTDETGNYNDDSGAVSIVINPADPTCSIDGFTGPYDGDSHGATGSCTGIDDEELAGLDLGDSFTDVPGGTANWTFTSQSVNYSDDSGSVEIVINEADPTCSVDGFTGPYDGDSHGATGSCTGIDDEELSGLDLGDSFTDVPGGTANWSFTDETGNYNDDSGTAEIVIDQADPTCSIDGFTGPYDGDSHGATGSCTGINDEELSGLDLGDSFINVPGGTANWSFTSQSVNYNDDSGSVEIVINEADPTCSVDGFTGPYDGDSHGATGSCTGIDDEELAGLDLGETFTDVPGGTANWSFTDETGNYNDDSGTAEIVINEADPTCSVDGFTGPYDGDSHGATGSCTGIDDEELAGLDLGDSFTNVPGGTANWSFTDESGNYSDDSGAVSIVINPADPTCSVDGFTGPYDGDSHGATGSCTGIDDEELSGLDLGETYTDVPGGTANWSFTDETGNYSNDSGAVSIVINPVDPTCSVDGFTGPYDGDSHGATGSCTGIDDEELSGLDLGDSFTNAPGGTANWTFTSQSVNYSDDSGTAEIVINEADPTCSVDGFTGPYDGDSHGATGSCTGIDDEELSGLDLGETYTDVPGGTANWSFTDETGNYNDDSGSVEIVIDQADPTCSIDGFTGPYDGDSHGATGSCTGINDEELSGLDLGDSFINVPGGTANWTFTSQSVNYNDDSGSVEIVINEADPTCSVDGFTGPYDGDSHGATGSCTGIDDEELAGLDLGETFTDVPGGTANWSFTDETGNYNDDSGTAEIVINEADPTCSVDGFTGPYDGDSHGATGSCTGIDDEELAGLDLGDSFTNVPGGTANWSFTDESGNYSDDSGAVSIVINPADPTCSIDGFTGNYDGDPHGATGSCTGIDDEELSGLDLGETYTDVPGGTANWTFTSQSDNYNDDSGSVEIVINGAEVSAEITAIDKPYDGLVDAEYTCDVVGEEDGADVDCDGAHPATFDDPNVGTRAATATELELSGTDAGNYTLGNTEDSDDADITKATLSVDAVDKTKEFGEDDPPLTYTLSGFIAPDDESNVAITGAGECTRDPGETVLGGPYEITCTAGDLEADNYSFQTGEPGELTITPDTSVPSVTINQALSQDDPTGDSPIVFDVEFSESVTGFADDDVELSGTAGATTANVSGSDAEYTVSVSGMTSSGTVIAAVKAAAATDGTNDSAASTSDDDTVEYVQPVTEFDPGPTATISGTPRVGNTLTAGEGSPSPTPDSFQYEWFADGTSIAGATNQTFTPTNAQVGKALTVKVTAVKAGFTNASDLSDPTGPVGTLGPKTLLVRAAPAALAGDRITIRVARLAPREAYTLKIDDEIIKTGKANFGGTVSITVRLPLSMEPGTYTVTVVGSLPDRTGTDTQQVRAPSSLGVVLTKPSVPAGGTQRVQVNDLLHGESVEIRYDGTLVSPSSAKGNSLGRYALVFPVGTTVGSHTVEVTGTYDGRTTTKTFNVTGP